MDARAWVRRQSWLDPGTVPEREDLPRYVAPLPAWLEDVGLAIAWVVVVVNLAGTAFGFWYYGFHPVPLSDPLVTWQLAREPVVMWPFVPDSPVATLFIALSLALWKLGRSNEAVNALAFFGCIKLGAWTPFVLVVVDGQGDTWWAMYQFLVWSHLAMVLEAFLIHRYSEFPTWAVLVALVWYGANDVVDYFVPVVGEPHHTTLASEFAGGVVDHSVAAHDVAAAGAVVLTLAATFLALATRIEKLELERERDAR
jgi:uncharacterized membrane protein YpjA